MRINDAYPPEPSDLKRFALRVLELIAWAVLITLLAVVITLGVANAQEATAPSVDLGPLAVAALEWSAPIALTVLTTLAAWAFKLFRQKTGWQIDGAVGSIVDKGLNRAVEFAVERLQDRAAGGIPIVVKNRAVEVAARYAIDKLPNALKHFDIDVNDPADPNLVEMIESRLLGWLVDPQMERADSLAAFRRMAAPVGES